MYNYIINISIIIIAITFTDFTVTVTIVFQLWTHCIKVGEEAEGRRSTEPEGQEVFEVELRLQRPPWDRQGSQQGAALGRCTWTRQRHKCSNEEAEGKVNTRDISVPG